MHSNFVKIKRKLLARHLKATRASVIILALITIFLFFYLIFLILKPTRVGEYFGLAHSFIFTPKNQILALNNRTNILILGKAGEGNPAPDLTDTIILASISHNPDPQVTLVSLPRDIWIKALRTKLNSIYYWGNQRQDGGGLVLAKSVTEDIVGVPIHYAVVVNFSGFKNIIDTLGGIEVDVKKGFIDKKFPIPGKENDECNGDEKYLCRYETIEFQKGLQTMDGETALKYARSRQSEDLEEGTDLARSARQQLILKSLKEKALSRQTLTSPRLIMQLIKEVERIIETDLNNNTLAILARRALQSRNSINNYNLPEDFLTNPPLQSKYDYLYVFVSATKNWDQIRNWFQNILP